MFSMKVFAMILALVFAVGFGGYCGLLLSAVNVKLGKICGWMFTLAFIAGILGKFGII